MTLQLDTLDEKLCSTKFEYDIIGHKCMKISKNMSNLVILANEEEGPNKNNELHPIPPHSPFYQIGIDFVGPLPITNRGNRYIIVAVDLFTKWPEA